MSRWLVLGVVGAACWYAAAAPTVRMELQPAQPGDWRAEGVEWHVATGGAAEANLHLRAVVAEPAPTRVHRELPFAFGMSGAVRLREVTVEAADGRHAGPAAILTQGILTLEGPQGRRSWLLSR